MADAVAVTATPDWRALLVAEVAAHPRGKAGVADRLGVKRAYVSRALATGHTSAGFKNGVPQAFIARVLGRFHTVVCHARGDEIQPRDMCRRFALGAAPTHNPLAMRIWRECQTCPNKPAPEVKP